MSINNLNEGVNKRVVFENGDYGIYLPYNLSAICAMVPHWCDDKKRKDATLQAFKESGVLYIVNDKKKKEWLVLKDEGSKVPLQKSGRYKMYTPSFNGYMYQHTENAKKYFSHSTELIKELNLNYSVNEMLKFGMPFTQEEMVEYSETSPFAKEIYDIIQSEIPNFDNLEKFVGRGDVQIVDYEVNPYDEAIAQGAIAIHPTEEGVMFYMTNEYYKEKFLLVHDDDDWAYESAMGNNHYGDCEEMDYEEMNYIGNYLSQKNKDEFDEIRSTMGIDQDFSTEEEGEVTDFLEKYFPVETDHFESDWLHSLGCAIGRGRAKGVREHIEETIVFEYAETGRLTEMLIPWSSLLRLVGKNNIENFVDIAEQDLNDLGGLSDMWYDNWDVDDEGLDDMNDDFNTLLTKIKEGDLASIKENSDKFEKDVVKQFGFEGSNYRNSYQSTYKLKNPIPHPYGKVTSDNPQGGPDTMIHIKDWSPGEDKITFYTTDYGYHTTDNKRESNLDGFIKFVEDLKTNPEIPFPEPTNEQYTKQIIDNIINRVIQENTQK